jgi:hypothetical protein
MIISSMLHSVPLDRRLITLALRQAEMSPPGSPQRLVGHHGLRGSLLPAVIGAVTVAVLILGSPLVFVTDSISGGLSLSHSGHAGRVGQKTQDLHAMSCEDSTREAWDLLRLLTPAAREASFRQSGDPRRLRRVLDRARAEGRALTVGVLGGSFSVGADLRNRSDGFAYLYEGLLASRLRHEVRVVNLGQ